MNRHFLNSLVPLFFLSFLFIKADAQFRVVGYIHPRGEMPDLDRLSFHQLTHINIAFINPDSLGNLTAPPGVDSIVARAHRNGVKVLASIGGGSHNPYYASLLKDDRRGVFADRLLQYAIDHQLDGIDVDLENDAIDSNYGKFIEDLWIRLRPKKKLLTAALATWNAHLISDGALKRFDFINIMSYDQTGPWRPDKPGPHATYEKAEEDLQYWRHTRRLSRKRLNLGLPFYGYCFGTRYGESMNFEEIIQTFPGAAEKDVVNPDGGGAIYYNGRPMIQRKTRLARQQAGGVMIWELFQDAQGPSSLLGAIDSTIKGSKP